MLLEWDKGKIGEFNIRYTYGEGLKVENQIKLICYQFANEKTSGVFMCNYHVCFQLGANGQTNSGQKHILVVRGGWYVLFSRMLWMRKC